MTWKAYRVVFKLKSPMHIGCGKIGNVQRTRPYVTGRVFWGALTMRLTRDATSGSATNSKQYEKFGEKVHHQLAYTYFYPAIKLENQDYKIQWLWKNESQFRRRFLSSYASTALVYPQQAADEGLLHEVEFISPLTLDEGKQVYLIGYVFEFEKEVEKEDCVIKWKDACKRLQMGGERGYGWGNVQCVEIKPVTDSQSLKSFGEQYSWEEHQEARDSSGKQKSFVVIKVPKSGNLLAHTSHTSSPNLPAKGEIEPLVGREWRSNNKDSQNNSINHYAGQHIEFCDLCWIPGSFVDSSIDFKIKNFGIWHGK